MPSRNLRFRCLKGFEKTQYGVSGGGANVVNSGYTKGDGLGAEIVGTFVHFSATDANRNARDSHVPANLDSTSDWVCSVFGALGNHPPSVELASPLPGALGLPSSTTRTVHGDDQWIFWVRPFIGAALVALYHQIVIRAIPFKTRA